MLGMASRDTPGFETWLKPRAKSCSPFGFGTKTIGKTEPTIVSPLKLALMWAMIYRASGASEKSLCRPDAAWKSDARSSPQI
jgi:hypothetical protein